MILSRGEGGPPEAGRAPSVPAPDPARSPAVWLELAGAARVTLVQGDRDQAVVLGGAEAQKAVDVDLVDRLLIIRPAGGWKFWSGDRIWCWTEPTIPQRHSSWPSI